MVWRSGLFNGDVLFDVNIFIYLLNKMFLILSLEAFVHLNVIFLLLPQLLITRLIRPYFL